MIIKETIVVEGRDDRSAVERAVEAPIIETHGFGISQQKWAELEDAYKRSGLIIFTDPDFSGLRIRESLLKRFPLSKQAFLAPEEAYKAGDIGIENAKPEAIRAALEKARAEEKKAGCEFTAADLVMLSGTEGSAAFRSRLGTELGIGSGNASAFLKKLNRLGITREEFDAAVQKVCREWEETDDK